MTNHIKDAVAEQRKQVAEMFSELAQVVDGKPHPVAIDALIMLALVMGKHHVCCTATTAKKLELAAGQLHADIQQNPLLYANTSNTKH